MLHILGGRQTTPFHEKFRVIEGLVVQTGFLAYLGFRGVVVITSA